MPAAFAPRSLPEAISTTGDGLVSVLAMSFAILCPPLVGCGERYHTHRFSSRISRVNSRQTPSAVDHRGERESNYGAPPAMPVPGTNTAWGFRYPLPTSALRGPSPHPPYKPNTLRPFLLPPF